MTLYHALSDPPRTCWACVDDAVNAPDEPMPEHDPEVAGADDDGPYCVCGHHVTDGAREAMADIIAILWVPGDEDAPWAPDTLEALAFIADRYRAL